MKERRKAEGWRGTLVDLLYRLICVLTGGHRWYTWSRNAAECDDCRHAVKGEQANSIWDTKMRRWKGVDRNGLALQMFPATCTEETPCTWYECNRCNPNDGASKLR